MNSNEKRLGTSNAKPEHRLTVYDTPANTAFAVVAASYAHYQMYSKMNVIRSGDAMSAFYDFFADWADDKDKVIEELVSDFCFYTESYAVENDVDLDELASAVTASVQSYLDGEWAFIKHLASAYPTFLKSLSPERGGGARDQLVDLLALLGARSEDAGNEDTANLPLLETESNNEAYTIEVLEAALSRGFGSTAALNKMSYKNLCTAFDLSVFIYCHNKRIDFDQLLSAYSASFEAYFKDKKRKGHLPPTAASAFRIFADGEEVRLKDPLPASARLVVLDGGWPDTALEFEISSLSRYCSSLAVRCPGDTWTDHHQKRWDTIVESLDRHYYLSPIRQLEIALSLVVKGAEANRFIAWLKNSALPDVDPRVRRFTEVVPDEDRFSHSFFAGFIGTLPVAEWEWESFRHIEVSEIGPDALEVLISCAPPYADRMPALLDIIDTTYEVDSCWCAALNNDSDKEEIGVNGLSPEEEIGETEHCVFRKKDDVWEISYKAPALHLKDTKGLRYIACLLETPYKQVHVLELRQLTEGAVAAPADSRYAHMSEEQLAEEGLSISWADSGVEILDLEAREGYRTRLLDIAEERSQAEERHRAGLLTDEELEKQVIDLDDESERIEREWNRATGLGGRPRTTSDQGEKARQAVQKNIKAARERIADGNPALAKHLEDSIETGYDCVYKPSSDDLVHWDT